MKLIHKGLILISVPLAFEIFFVFGFGSLLKRSMEQLQSEVHTKMVIAYAERLECGLSEAAFLTSLCSVRRGPTVRKRYDEIWVDIAKNYFALEKIAGSQVKKSAMRDIRSDLQKQRQWQYLIWKGGPHALEVPGVRPEKVPAKLLAWFVTSREEPDSNAISQLIHDEMTSVSQGPKLHAEMSTQFRNFLLFGVLGDLMLVIALSLFFGKSIEERLRNLMDTTHRLSRGADLAPALQGNDELAQLDVLLHDTAAKLIEVERFKKHLVGVVSHELKAPLSAVQILLGLVAAEGNQISKEAISCIELGQRNCHRLQLMVAELLDVEIMSSGKVRLTCVTSHSRELMQNAAEMVRAIASDHQIELVIEDCNAQVLLDPDRMHQVLVNLLSNAIKFSPSGSQVILESKDIGTHIEFSITDHGPGIPEDLHKSIFEVFNQANQPKDSKIKGTGMGLAITKTIVEAHGGAIGIESSPGHGCTVNVRIPKDASLLPLERPQPQARMPQKEKSVNPWRMRIRHKGLILIGLPLLTEILLVGFLATFLQQADKEIEQQSISRTVAAESRKVVQYATTSAILALMGLGRQEVADIYQQEDQKLLAKMQQLKRSCGEDKTRAASFKAIAQTISEIRKMQSKLIAESMVHEITLQNTDAKLVQEYLNYWRQLSSDVTVLAIHEELLETDVNRSLGALSQNLDKVLLIGLTINLLSAVGLTIFLNQNITKRIANVRQNAQRMLTKEPLLAPIAGSDEITHLDQAFRDAAAALNKEQKLKQQLVAIVSHELRTPLTALSTSLELLSCGALGKLPAQAQERVVQAESGTERLIALINDVLDIEKMDAGKFVLNMEDVPVQIIVDRAIACVNPLAKTKDISVKCTVAADTVRGDADRLVQVLVNLLSNAIKFSPDGQVVGVGSYIKEDTGLVITVSDSGCGIPSQMEEKIFDTFISLSDKELNPTGTGLGLPISKAIVEQHGGTIGVESVPGKSSTFWFCLPLITDASAKTNEQDV